MRIFRGFVAAAALLWTIPTLAADGRDAKAAGAGCATGMVCAADPATVAAALMEAGYRAKPGKMDNGAPMISSAAAGYNYDVFFSGCTDNKACKSLTFSVTFTDDDQVNSAELANEWNAGYRFSTMAFNKDKTLSVTYDVTTVGGINKANFADVIEWWSIILGDLRVFFNTRNKP
ncbi:MAG: YbjN domain-containing protein [Novosphingobium sp.]|jgi:hypothetical protein|nr:YbjN domain-containing protein [Brevundimonas sp.]